MVLPSELLAERPGRSCGVKRNGRRCCAFAVPPWDLSCCANAARPSACGAGLIQRNVTAPCTKREKTARNTTPNEHLDHVPNGADIGVSSESACVGACVVACVVTCVPRALTYQTVRRN